MTLSLQGRLLIGVISLVAVGLQRPGADLAALPELAQADPA